MNTIPELIGAIIREHYAYLSECEHDHTEAEKRIALLKANTKQLQAYTELAEHYFKGQMQERERLFNSASKVLDKAIRVGDLEYALIATRTIEIVHRKSPFSFD